MASRSISDDEDIRSEMENYHIHKKQDNGSSHSYIQTTDHASSDPPLTSTMYQAMNDDISNFEVKSPSERDQIHLVLMILWHKCSTKPTGNSRIIFLSSYGISRGRQEPSLKNGSKRTEL